MLTAGEDATKEDCRIHRRDFRVPNAFAGIDVGPVVKESSMVGKLLPERAKGGGHALDGLVTEDEPFLFSNAQGGETKTSCGDTGHYAIIGRGADVATVLHQPSRGIGLLPEVSEGEAFQFVQEITIGIRQSTGGWRICRLRMLLVGGVECGQEWSERKTEAALKEPLQKPSARESFGRNTLHPDREKSF